MALRRWTPFRFHPGSQQAARSNLYDYAGESLGRAVFAPPLTRFCHELGEVSRLRPEWEEAQRSKPSLSVGFRRKPQGLDRRQSTETQSTQRRLPILADDDYRVSELYGHDSIRPQH